MTVVLLALSLVSILAACMSYLWGRRSAELSFAAGLAEGREEGARQTWEAIQNRMQQA